MVDLKTTTSCFGGIRKPQKNRGKHHCSDKELTEQCTTNKLEKGWGEKNAGKKNGKGNWNGKAGFCNLEVISKTKG